MNKILNFVLLERSIEESGVEVWGEGEENV